MVIRGAIHRRVVSIVINRNTFQTVLDKILSLVLQRFYHQQNQLREKEREKQQQKREMNTSTNPFVNSYIPKYHPANQIPSQLNNQTTSQQHISDELAQSTRKYSTSPTLHHSQQIGSHGTESLHQQQQEHNCSPSSNFHSNIPVYNSQNLASSPKQFYTTTTTVVNSTSKKFMSPPQTPTNTYGGHSGGTSSGYGTQNVYSNNLYGRTTTKNASKEGNIKDDQGNIASSLQFGF